MNRIFMIGDSTMQFNNINRYPQTGWGQVLPMFLRDEVFVYDYAKNGRSTKSFIDEGRFSHVLSLMEKGDYLICQFGHNDEKLQDPLRGTHPFDDFQKNFKYFYEEATKKGCHVIFLTSICRRNFENGHIKDTHKDYPKALLELSKELNVTCIDMNKITMDIYEELGEEATKKFHMIFDKGVYQNYPEGKDDSTHLRFDGAVMVCQAFRKAIFNTNDPIKELFLDPSEIEEIDWAMLKD
jgi:lysophospholipase L1-like esterase